MEGSGQSNIILSTSWPGQLWGMVPHTDLLCQKQPEELNLFLTVAVLC